MKLCPQQLSLSIFIYSILEESIDAFVQVCVHSERLS